MGIYFQEVGFTYFPNKRTEKNQYVIENVNLSIQSEGEFIVVVGKTGSGKSTLVSLMNALLKATVGVVKVFDEDILKAKSIKAIRRKIGLVFQFPEAQLFEETVLKDVMFGPKNFKLDNPEERAKKALEIFGLDDAFHKKNPFRLSGGEMRKVAISGIMASDPDILILDEPTVGLDPLTKNELINLLKNINLQKKKSIIMITHDMDTLWEVATRVIVVCENKIVYDGDKYNLFQEENLFSWGLKFPEVIKITQELNQKLNLNLELNSDNIESLLDKLKEALYE